jgi:hypothetical protein
MEIAPISISIFLSIRLLLNLFELNILRLCSTLLTCIRVALCAGVRISLRALLCLLCAVEILRSCLPSGV